MALRTRALALAGVLALPALSASAAAAPQKPNLRLDFPDGTGEIPYLDTLEPLAPGRILYRFDAVIHNDGPGPFELHGTNLQSSPLVQQVEYDGAASTSFPIPGTMRYANDNHNHWHFLDAARYELQTVGGQGVGAVAKTGFCMFDSYGTGAYEAPATGDNPWCSYGHPEVNETRMGISPGSGDLYYAALSYQWVDVTGLAAGPYRLWGRVNPNGAIDETTTADDVTTSPRTIAGPVASAPAPVSVAQGQSRSLTLGGAIVGPGELVHATPAAGDLQPIGAGVQYRIVTAPAHGRLSAIGPSGTVTYTADAGYSGPDSFGYQVGDSRGLLWSAPATVRVNPPAGTSAPAAQGAGSGTSAAPAPISATPPAVAVAASDQRVVVRLRGPRRARTGRAILLRASLSAVAPGTSGLLERRVGRRFRVVFRQPARSRAVRIALRVRRPGRYTLRLAVKGPGLSGRSTAVRLVVTGRPRPAVRGARQAQFEHLRVPSAAATTLTGATICGARGSRVAELPIRVVWRRGQRTL